MSTFNLKEPVNQRINNDTECARVSNAQKVQCIYSDIIPVSGKNAANGLLTSLCKTHNQFNVAGGWLAVHRYILFVFFFSLSALIFVSNHTSIYLSHCPANVVFNKKKKKAATAPVAISSSLLLLLLFSFSQILCSIYSDIILSYHLCTNKHLKFIETESWAKEQNNHDKQKSSTRTVNEMLSIPMRLLQ